MTAMSQFLETQLLTHLFLSGTFSKPVSLAIALSTAALSATFTGALTNAEVYNSGSYARQPLAPSNSNWAAVANGTTSNTPAIVFPAATLDWGTITNVAICDSTAYGGGDVLFWGTLTGNKIVSNGDTFQFAAGQLNTRAAA
jgi:hypothetical protein